jgi:hypothetical protein
MAFRILKSEQPKGNGSPAQVNSIKDLTESIQLGNLTIDVQPKPNNSLKVRVSDLDSVRHEQIVINAGNPVSQYDVLKTFRHKAKVFFESKDQGTEEVIIKPLATLTIKTETLEKRHTLDIL